MWFDVWDIKNDSLRNIEPDYEKNPMTKTGPGFKFVEL